MTVLRLATSQPELFLTDVFASDAATRFGDQTNLGEKLIRRVDELEAISQASITFAARLFGAHDGRRLRWSETHLEDLTSGETITLVRKDRGAKHRQVGNRELRGTGASKNTLTGDPDLDERVGHVSTSNPAFHKDVIGT